MFKKSIIWGILVIIVVAITGCGQEGGSDATSKPYLTCSMLFNIASQGCEGYKKARGAWPGSIGDIDSFVQGMVHPDAWNHDLAYTPFDSAKGYGEIISYGRDGKAGGTGEDADIVIRFPLAENADWNRQQAKNIQVPAHGNPHWFDSYVNGN